MSDDRRAVVVGPGRVGRAVELMLRRAGWSTTLLGRHDPVATCAASADVVLLAVPDREVAGVAGRVGERPATLFVHFAGSLTLDALAPHARRASIHPLVPVAGDPQRGAASLAGAWMAIAGDAGVAPIVEALGGRSVAVAEPDRALYHAGAAIAANHLTGLLGQVARIAEQVGVPLDAYLALTRAAVDAIATLGPEAALTGPIARRDWDTVRRHLDALPERERATYLALAAETARLAGVELPFG